MQRLILEILLSTFEFEDFLDGVSLCQFNRLSAVGNGSMKLTLTAQNAQANYPDSKVHGANMGLTWVLSAPDGPHVGPMNLAIRVVIDFHKENICFFQFMRSHRLGP